MSVVDPFVGAVDRAMRFPVNALEFTNILLTTDDAVVGATPRDVVWTHRETTLYRYQSSKRRYGVPLLLVFALINRPEIFDLHPGRSLVEFLIDEGFDVFLVDWGYPDEKTPTWAWTNTSATSSIGRCARHGGPAAPRRCR